MSEHGRIDPHDYLLGELSEPDEREAERLLREDPDFAAQVERLRPVVTQLERVPDEVWEGIPPLEGLGVADAPAAETTAGPRARRRVRWLPSRPAWPSWTVGGAAAALAAVVIALVVVVGEDDPEGTSLTLTAVPQSGVEASGTATLGGSGGEAAVELNGLDPNREGEFYELWLLNDTDDLVSLGSFRVEETGTTEVELPLPVDPSAYGFVDISVEPDDGDASHSGDSVLRGPIQSS